MNTSPFYFDSRIEWLLAYPIDLIPMLAESYVVEMRADVGMLKASHNAPDDLINSLHKIKGALGMIGYHGLYDRVTWLLGQLRHQPNLARSDIEDFIVELESSIEALQQWNFDTGEVS